MFRVVLLFTVLAITAAFVSRAGMRIPLRRHMAEEAEDPAFAAIRAKMEKDPNYNPMNDPEARAVRKNSFIVLVLKKS